MRGETVKVVRYTPTGETDPGGSPVTKVAGRVCASIHMTTR